MNFVEFTILWTDYDSMVQLAVKASNSVQATYGEVYLYPDELEEFATALRGATTGNTVQDEGHG